MRPTFAEQLRGLRRILDAAVAPALVDDYAIEALAGVQRALAMLETRQHEVVPFLRWDNAATAQLLASVASVVPLSGPVEPDSPVDPCDSVALDTENERLRGLLAAVIGPLTLASGGRSHPEPAAAADHEAEARAAYAAVVAHLRERVARYPYVTTGALPAR